MGNSRWKRRKEEKDAHFLLRGTWNFSHSEKPIFYAKPQNSQNTHLALFALFNLPWLKGDCVCGVTSYPKNLKKFPLPLCISECGPLIVTSGCFSPFENSGTHIHLRSAAAAVLTWASAASRPASSEGRRRPRGPPYKRLRSRKQETRRALPKAKRMYRANRGNKADS